jgi:signal transduction histidine kinase
MMEIYDGIDEGLSNLRQELVVRANQDAQYVTDMAKHDPLNMILEEISYDKAKDIVDEFITTKVYFATELEDEEVRMLVSAFYCESNQRYYLLKIFTSTVESEDLIKNMLYLLLALWLSLAIAFIFGSKRIIRNSTKSFYHLLEMLKTFELNQLQTIDLPATSVKEFSELNKSVKKLLDNNIRVYNEQKNFIENASHEMQTPLAIVIGKLELLMDEPLSREQMEEISHVLNILNRMKRLNKQLLLLSKIRNNQFPEGSEIHFTDVFDNVIDEFQELIEHKGLTLNIRKEGDPVSIMNEDLAYIMITNLVKNAIAHNIRNGNIDICIKDDQMVISNTGKKIDSNVDIFERYNTGDHLPGSSGIGLSIVKSIADLYHFEISHKYNNQHITTLTIK